MARSRGPVEHGLKYYGSPNRLGQSEAQTICHLITFNLTWKQGKRCRIGNGNAAFSPRRANARSCAAVGNLLPQFSTKQSRHPLLFVASRWTALVCSPYPAPGQNSSLDSYEIFLISTPGGRTLAAMSEANKQLVMQWFEQVWNKKDESAIHRMFQPHGKSYGFPGPDDVLLGPGPFVEIHRSFCGAFPDLRFEMEDMVAEGDTVAIRWKTTFTHSGDSLGFPASGKKETLCGSSFIRVEDGKILEGWNHMDLGALFQRLQAPGVEA
jgi:predicted ester cyclase